MARPVKIEGIKGSLIGNNIIWSSFIVLLGLMTFGYFSLKGEYLTLRLCPGGTSGVTVLLIDVVTLYPLAKRRNLRGSSAQTQNP